MLPSRHIGLALAMAVAIAGPCAGPNRAAAAGRAELCARLSRQVERALLQNSRADRVVAARALQRKADRLCAVRKAAQGLRAYADALDLLGVKPNVDND